MNRKDILTVYKQGPEAVVSLVQTLVSTYEKRIQSLDVRNQELVHRAKKTPKTVISHLLLMGWKSRKYTASVASPRKKQVDNRDTLAIRFAR